MSSTFYGEKARGCSVSTLSGNCPGTALEATAFVENRFGPSEQ